MGATSRVTRRLLAAGTIAAGVAAIGLFLPEGRTQGSLGVRGAVLALREALLSDD